MHFTHNMLPIGCSSCLCLHLGMRPFYPGSPYSHGCSSSSKKLLGWRPSLLAAQSCGRSWKACGLSIWGHHIETGFHKVVANWPVSQHCHRHHCQKAKCQDVAPAESSEPQWPFRVQTSLIETTWICRSKENNEKQPLPLFFFLGWWMILCVYNNILQRLGMHHEHNDHKPW